MCACIVCVCRNTHEALGDVICRLAPFLKLYSTYTAGFEDAVKTLTECTKKDRKFDAVVREFEVIYHSILYSVIYVYVLHYDA